MTSCATRNWSRRNWCAIRAGARSSPRTAASCGSATLLHDLGKPATTRYENGRWTAPGHARRGAIVARRLLWEAGLHPFARERICGLVRYHMAPFHLIDSERAVRRRGRDGARGRRAPPAPAHPCRRAQPRIASDIDTLTVNVDLLAEARRRFRLPRPGLSLRLRPRALQLFARRDRDPAYAAYDDTRSARRRAQRPARRGQGPLDLPAPRRPPDEIWLDRLRHPEGACAAPHACLRRGPALHLERHQPHRPDPGPSPSRCSPTTTRTSRSSPWRRRPTCSAPATASAATRPVGGVDHMLDRWEAPSITECHRLEIFSA